MVLSDASTIKKVEIMYHRRCFKGFQFYDKDGKILVSFQTCPGSYEWNHEYNKIEEYLLNEDERLVGFRSESDANNGFSHSLVRFIVGKLE
jgi:hypothetical protein